MADPFLEASDLFTRAFNAQELAARRQMKAQRASMRSDEYTSQLEDQAYNAPVPPMNAPYGVFEEGFQPTGDPMEDIKQELMQKTRANRRAAESAQAVRAGNGNVTPSMR
jgi:hypothetical protein